jgi:hypothetical protein
VLDSSRPETFILTSPSNPSQTMDATFLVSSNKQGATFDYCLDGLLDVHTSGGGGGSLFVGEEEEGGGEHQRCWYNVSNDVINFEGVKEGYHNLTVRATVRDHDNGTHDDTLSKIKDASPSIVHWSIDANAPDTALLASQPTLSGSTMTTTTHLQSLSFAFASSEAVRLFQVQLNGDEEDEDGGVWYDLDLQPNGDDDERYCLAAMTCSLIIPPSRRRLNGKENDEEEEEPIISSSNKAITHSSPVTATTSKRITLVASQQVTVSWYFSSSTGGLNYAAMDVLTLMVDNLSNGPHSIAMRSVDGAGNFDGSPASVNFLVDTSLKPSVPLAPRAVTAVAGNGNVTVSWLPPPDDGLSPHKGISYFHVVGSTTFTGNTMWINHYVKGPSAPDDDEGDGGSGGGGGGDGGESTFSSAVSPIEIDAEGRYYTRVPNLQNRNKYRFSVISLNAQGLSSSLSWSSDWATPLDPSDPCSVMDCNDNINQ